MAWQHKNNTVVEVDYQNRIQPLTLVKHTQRERWPKRVYKAITSFCLRSAAGEHRTKVTTEQTKRQQVTSTSTLIKSKKISFSQYLQELKKKKSYINSKKKKRMKGQNQSTGTTEESVSYVETNEKMEERATCN